MSFPAKNCILKRHICTCVCLYIYTILYLNVSVYMKYLKKYGSLSNANDSKHIMNRQWEQSFEITVGDWRGNKMFLYKQILIMRKKKLIMSKKNQRWEAQGLTQCSSSCLAASAWNPASGAGAESLRNLVLGKWGVESRWSQNGHKSQNKVSVPSDASPANCSLRDFCYPSK